MVAVKGMKRVTDTEVHVEVFCSAFSELANIPGIPTGMSVQAGSLAYTASGDVAIYDGTTWTEVE